MEGPDPLFVIGAARSGTKFLRDTLAAAAGIAVVPYDINYVWRRGHEHFPHDELDASGFAEHLAEDIRRDVLRQVDAGGSEEATMFVEKTVSNTLRVPFIDCVFPDARYIHLVRDGRDVVESSYRCWQERPDWRYLLRKAWRFPLSRWRYGAKFMVRLLGGIGSSRPRRTWGPRYRGIMEDLCSKPLEIVVARQWRHCVRASLQGLGALPSWRVYSIRYEDIIASPDWIPELLDFVGCAPNVDAVVSHYRETLRPPSADGWSRTFSAGQREQIWEEIQDVVRKLGYPATRRS